jgi:hypothetical protein
MRRPSPAILILGASLVLSIATAACGPTTSTATPSASDVGASASPGGSGAIPSTPAPSGSAAAPSPTPLASRTPGPTPTSKPTSVPTATPKPSATSGGSVSAMLCGLLSVGQVGDVMGVGALTRRAGAGDQAAGSCTYLAGDRVVATTTYLVSGAAKALDAYKGESQSVAGIADAAIWVPRTHTLFIRNADSLLGIQLLDTIVPADEIKSKTVVLGKAAAARLP